MPHSAVLPHSTPTLPAAPRTDDLLATLRARLDVLEREVLPAMRDRSDWLTRIWYSDEPDAVHIHMSDRFAVPCTPAGADRLASAVAEEAAMAREASALRDLQAALETYDAGGAATLAELDDRGGETEDIAEVRLVPRPPAFHDRQNAAARAHARGMHTYLSSLRRELRAALGEGDRERLAVLATEYGALRARLQQHMPQRGARATDPTRRSSTSDRMGRRPSARSA